MNGLLVTFTSQQGPLFAAKAKIWNAESAEQIKFFMIFTQLLHNKICAHFGYFYKVWTKIVQFYYFEAVKGQMGQN